MATSPRARLVYSTASGRLCPKCGWPVADCRCAERRDEPVPAQVSVHLRLEKSGRGGKSVTVIDGLPKNRALLRELVAELKRSCGSGGTATETTVEIQGDQREKIRPSLAARGWRVRG